MVDFTTNLSNQIILERFRSHGPYSSFTNILSWRWLPRTWAAVLFAYGIDAPKRLVDSGYYTDEGLSQRGVPGVTPHCLVRLGLSLPPFVDTCSPSNETSVPMAVPGEREGKDSLLNLACGHLLWGNKEEGLDILSKLRDLDEGWATFILEDSYGGFFQRRGWVNPTAPEDFGLEPINFEEGQFFGVNQMSWLGKPTVSYLLKSAHAHNLPVIRAISAYHDQTWDGSVELKCEAYVRNEKSARVDWDRMPLALGGCSLRFVIGYLQRMTGVRKALGVVRADTPDHLFTLGLRKMNSESLVKNIGPWVARPLRLDDLKGIGAETLARLLYKLPWTIVEPLARGYHDKVTVKFARLIDKPDYLEMIRDSLVDHPKRLEQKKVLNYLDDRWEENIRPHLEHYDISCRFRNELRGAGLNQEEILLLLLLGDEMNLIEVAKSLDSWPTLERYLPQVPQYLRVTAND